MNPLETNFKLAQEQYAAFGVDVEAAMTKLATIPISLNCWQGDDVGGFESNDGLQGGGILATGNYPGKARNADELRKDASFALSLIPGKHRFNLHAIYLEHGGKKIDRNEISHEHFQSWIDWAKENDLGLDFNPTFFSHSLAADGFTLASNSESRRKFWVEHGICCRKIGEAIGKALKTPCVINFWMPDGSKDIPADRLGPRERMKQSLDEIFSETISPAHLLDAVESKLFGIGSESYVVGSHEFFMGYAVKNKKLLCIDSGHFHPTESIADKFSSLSLYVDEFLLHVSRGVRWDSDHVVIGNDELRSIGEELVRCDLLSRAHIGLDFFDATINRIAAWVIGTRAILKSLLIALLEPRDILRQYENDGDGTSRLALMEEWRQMPFGAIWNMYCKRENVLGGFDWIDQVRHYETKTLSKRK
ncbi:MAG: L-rhamnose isomerase [Thermoguttaceae bacterium]